MYGESLMFFSKSFQSIGTSDISIGDFSNSDFSCMDDDTKVWDYLFYLFASASYNYILFGIYQLCIFVDFVLSTFIGEKSIKTT